jgi:hypothetical protein
MAALPEGLTQKDIDRYAQLDAGIKKLADEHKTLNEKIKKAHEDAGISGKKTLIYTSDKYGSVIVKIGEQKRLDAAALEEKHPYERFPQFWRMQFDKDAVPADVQAKFRTNIIPTLSISTGE